MTPQTGVSPYRWMWTYVLLVGGLLLIGGSVWVANTLSSQTTGPITLRNSTAFAQWLEWCRLFGWSFIAVGAIERLALAIEMKA